MNIHPLFVHFPIALLLVYSFFEIIRIRSWQQAPWIIPVKRITLLIGVLFSFISLNTGELAEHNLSDPALLRIVEKHSLFATTATYIYVALLVAYLTEVLVSQKWWGRVPRVIQTFLLWYARVPLSSRVRLFLAFAGAIAITITGALGGAMVYGPTVDPVVWFVYKTIVGL